MSGTNVSFTANAADLHHRAQRSRMLCRSLTRVVLPFGTVLTSQNGTTIVSERWDDCQEGAGEPMTIDIADIAEIHVY